MEKLKNLVNPKKWFEGFIIQKFSKKVVTYAVTALVGVVSSPAIAGAMTEWGVSVDKEKLSGTLLILITGLAGALLNTAKHGPLKEEPK
jgi:hypothetical protein